MLELHFLTVDAISAVAFCVVGLARQDKAMAA